MGTRDEKKTAAVTDPAILDLSLEPPAVNPNPGPEYRDENREFAGDSQHLAILGALGTAEIPLATQLLRKHIRDSAIQVKRHMRLTRPLSRRTEARSPRQIAGA